MAAAATITGYFSYLSSKGAQKAVVDHVNDETGTIERYEGTMSRMEGKIDSILEWQGQHEAFHRRHDQLGAS